MALHLFTAREKLEAIESLIQDGRADPRMNILRAIAADLRGAMDHAPNVTLTELRRRLTAAKAGKPRGAGYMPSHLIGIGEELIARWPTVERALKLMNGEKHG